MVKMISKLISYLLGRHILSQMFEWRYIEGIGWEYMKKEQKGG